MKTILQKLIAEAEESERVANVATEGPWDHYYETGLRPMVVTYNETKEGFRSLKESVACSGSIKNYANMTFIAHSRTALPRHAKQVRVLVEALELALYYIDSDNLVEACEVKVTALLAQLEEK